VDIINDSILVGEKGRRSIASQHHLLHETLLLNHIYLPAVAKEFSISFKVAKTI